MSTGIHEGSTSLFSSEPVPPSLPPSLPLPLREGPDFGHGRSVLELGLVVRIKQAGCHGEGLLEEGGGEREGGREGGGGGMAPDLVDAVRA